MKKLIIHASILYLNHIKSWQNQHNLKLIKNRIQKSILKIQGSLARPGQILKLNLKLISRSVKI